MGSRSVRETQCQEWSKRKLACAFYTFIHLVPHSALQHTSTAVLALCFEMMWCLTFIVDEIWGHLRLTPLNVSVKASPERFKLSREDPSMGGISQSVHFSMNSDWIKWQKDGVSWGPVLISLSLPPGARGPISMFLPPCLPTMTDQITWNYNHIAPLPPLSCFLLEG